MKIPNPAVRLPAWPWLQRFDRWRCQQGILTGRWTQTEIDDIHRRAHAMYLDLQEHID